MKSRISQARTGAAAVLLGAIVTGVVAFTTGGTASATPLTTPTTPSITAGHIAAQPMG
ncbi:hypothetical protein ACQPXB_21760 [Amycolatopsis sp. CA-161197]|uniref:hypothetical protein n=1 Tax=Amycolatopsis sp. CA-161197 TaxID=3239922 RepID=UPI003D8EC6D1